MLESESSALPFGDSASMFCAVSFPSRNDMYYITVGKKMQVLFEKNVKKFLRSFLSFWRHENIGVRAGYGFYEKK